MAVYYKFKSAKDYDSVSIEGHFISVANLKEKIFDSKHLGRGTDFDLVISNAQTNEEYLDDGMLVPKNTSVLVRRVPGRPRMTIVTEKREEPKETEIPKEQVLPPKNGFLMPDPSQFNFPDEESEWDEFGHDLYALPEVPQVLQTQTQSQPTITNKADEDSKIRAFVDATASDWQRQTQESYAGRGYGRGSGGRGLAGRGFGRGMERKTPPQGYVCHRCKIPGHFIQHCPTNGDPNYDIKRVKPPTGIPKSMLVANPDGSYALPSGAVAVLRPNEAAFEKEVEGLPSSRSVGDLPPELHCPLCKEVMKDAVLTSRCCFKSFCDKCIRDHILSKSKCVCGATSIRADDLLPNMTLRDTINRILETTTSSAENAGSWLQVQDMESARCPRPKVPSPSLSGCAKEAHTAPSKSDVPDLKEENISEKKTPVNVQQQSSERNRSTKTPEQLEGTPESMSTKELLSQESTPMVGEEVQQKPPGGELVKKKKRKRARQLPSSNETQWRAAQDFSAEGSVIPFAPTAYNPYWPATQWSADGYMTSSGSVVPYMGYGPAPCDTSFGAIMPPDMYAAQGYMQGFVPPVQRDYMDYGMVTHNSGHVMSREEFEARKADLRKKREQEQRYNSRDQTRDMLGNGGDMVLPKQKMRLSSVAPATERHRESEPSHLSPRAQAKRKADRDDAQMKDGRYPTDGKLDSRVISDVEVNKTIKPGFAGGVDKKQKGSVFSRISFPDDVHIGQVKKRNISSHDGTNGFREHESTIRLLNGSKAHYDDGNPVKRIVNGRRYMYDDDLSDNEQNFKRKTTTHRRELSEDWDDDKHPDSSSRSSKILRDRVHQNKV